MQGYTDHSGQKAESQTKAVTNLKLYLGGGHRTQQRERFHSMISDYSYLN